MAKTITLVLDEVTASAIAFDWFYSHVEQHYPCAFRSDLETYRTLRAAVTTPELLAYLPAAPADSDITEWLGED